MKRQLDAALAQLLPILTAEETAAVLSLATSLLEQRPPERPMPVPVPAPSAWTAPRERSGHAPPEPPSLPPGHEPSVTGPSLFTRRAAASAIPSDLAALPKPDGARALTKVVRHYLSAASRPLSCDELLVLVRRTRSETSRQRVQSAIQQLLNGGVAEVADGDGNSTTTYRLRAPRGA